MINLMISLSNTGYGIAGKYIAHELIKRGEDITIFPHGGFAENIPKDRDLIKLCEGNKNNWDFGASCLNIWHQFDLAKHIGHGAYTGFPIFELDSFNEREVAHLQVPDKLCVTSKWAKNILEKFTNLSRGVDVIPLGVDLEIFNPDGRTTNIKDNKDQYVFLNCGKWEFRKGHDAIINAFNKAFKFSDNVKLIMAPHNPFLNEQELSYWVNLYKDSPLGHKIQILPELKTHNDVATLMRSVDCGVFPSRAEGWNLELLEMMACGKPVIATNYSAHTEFCTEESTMLIEVDGLEDAYDGKWFHGHGKWMEFSYKEEEQLIHYMRTCYKTELGFSIKGNTAGIKISKQFTWENTVNKLLEIL